MAHIFLFLTTIFKGGKIFRDLIKELVPGIEEHVK